MKNKQRLKRMLVSSLVLGSIIAGPITQVMADEQGSISAIISEAKTIDKTSEKTLNASITKLETAITDYDNQNKKLQADVDGMAKELDGMSKDIVARNKQLKSQVVDMQTSTQQNSLVHAIVSSDSISDMIQKVSAMSTLSSANDKALKDLKKQKTALEKKQKENQEKINTIIDNQQKLNEARADLEVAKLELQKKKEDTVAVNQALQKAEQKSQEVHNLPTTIVDNSVVPGSINISPVYDGNTYPVGQCTWGVKALAPWVGNYWGNANQWGASAQAAGHSIGNTPRVGAIAVWPTDGGGYGHVAVITKVNSATSIEVLEANYAGNQSIGNYRGEFNPNAVWSGSSVYYIYP